MKTLIVEDDFTCRLALQGILKSFGEVHIAMDGKEGVDAVRIALAAGAHYDLICLDIMMPEMDGQQALKQIRALEKQAGIVGKNEAKVLMTTSMDDPKNVFEAYHRGGANSYLVKPVDGNNVIDQLQILGLPA